MCERPILFSGPMVRAIFEDRKTQTRRVVHPQPPPEANSVDSLPAPGGGGDRALAGGHRVAPYTRCPHGVPGDVLWVRETWKSIPGANKIWYRADDSYRCFDDQGEWFGDDWKKTSPPWRWRSPIYMPKWAARLWLRVTDVRVERLQEIGEEDARAEGVEPWVWADVDPTGVPRDEPSQQYRAGFIDLWDSINAKRGHGWGANPWVWAVAFDRISSRVQEAPHE